VRLALTRDVSPAIERCELTHLSRAPIDLARARAQHDGYEAALRACGCVVERLPAGHDMPDAPFVEDIALVFDEVAILTRPGAPSRRAETAALRDALAPHRPLVMLDAPATLDGGDVLVVEREALVGLSTRTNAAGVEALSAALAPHGYRVRATEVRGCLHLKTAVTVVADDALLVNASFVAVDALPRLRRIEVDPSEPMAANALRAGRRVLHPAHHPRTRERLVAAGLDVVPVALDELAKAEAGVTCCSLVFDVP
jgi:dimethylargininase